MAEAKMKLTAKPSFFSKLLGAPESRFEEAVEMCKEAATQFKLSKNWDRAGAANVLAADCQLKMAAKFEAATCFVEASTMYKKGNSKEAADCLLQAVSLFAGQGKFTMAAKQAFAAGELYETSLSDLRNAIKSYEQTVEYYEMEDSGSSKNKALIKIATISATLEDWERAYNVFEAIAKTMTDNALLKWSAKEYFLKAGLCRLASGDAIGAKSHAEEYQVIYAGMRDSRETNLLMALADVCEEKDVDKYTALITEYDAMSPLDDWMTSVLLAIKKSITTNDLL